MLTKLKEMGREKCVQYWPIDRSIRYGYFIVDNSRNANGSHEYPLGIFYEYKIKFKINLNMKNNFSFNSRRIY